MTDSFCFNQIKLTFLPELYQSRVGSKPVGELTAELTEVIALELLDEDDTPEPLPVPGVEDAEERVVRPDLLAVVAPEDAPTVVSRAGLTPQHGGLAQADHRLGLRQDGGRGPQSHPGGGRDLREAGRGGLAAVGPGSLGAQQHGQAGPCAQDL